MNTQHKTLRRLRGEDCGHTFLDIDGQVIRSARELRPDRDEHGDDKTGPCPVPKCRGDYAG